MKNKVSYIAALVVFGMVMSQLSVALQPLGAEADANDGAENASHIDFAPRDRPGVSESTKGDMRLIGYEGPVAFSGDSIGTVRTVPGLGEWSFRDAHQIDKAEGLGYDGSGIVVGVADSGVDFSKSELQDALLRGLDGWPVATDISSLREYLGRGVIDSDSWFADTSFNLSATGEEPPSFEYIHSPRFTMNGREDDFNTVDKMSQNTKGYKVTTDGEFWDGEQWLPLSDVGGYDFNLQKLFVSRDLDNWYFGFNTEDAQVDRSYGLYLDFDDAAGGAEIGPMGASDPRGNYLDTETAHTARVNSVAYHPDNVLLASCSDGSFTDSSDRESILIWDEEGRIVRILRDPTTDIDDMRAVEWTPDGGYLVARSRNHVMSWDTGTWELVGAERAEVGGLRDHLSIAPNGTWAATPNGYQAMIFKPASMEIVNNPLLCTDIRPIQSVEFSPNGDRLAVSNDRGTVRLYDSEDLVEVGPTPIHVIQSSTTGQGHGASTRVRALAWSPNGTYLATGGDDGRLFIWNTGSGEIVSAWNGTVGYNPLLASSGEYAISGLIWNDDRLVVGTGNGTLVIIDPETFGIQKIVNNAGNVPVSSIGAGTVPHYLFLGSYNGAIRLVDLDASAGTDIVYEPYLQFRPDMAVYIDYTAERYAIDENDMKVIGAPDGISDPQLYIWEPEVWNSSRLSQHGEDMYHYQGNKDLYTDTDGLTEITLFGFVQLAVPRKLTDRFGTNSLSVKLFITGTEPSVAQDCVPRDGNVDFPDTDFETTETRSLSSFAHVQFPETTIELTDIVSKSGTYHYGFHPSHSLRTILGPSDYVGVLVVDANEPGVYDTVIIDLNVPEVGNTPRPNYVFDDDDPVATKGNPFLAIDMLDRSTTPPTKQPDGIMDYSAGFVYHISDGSPLPYSERLTELEMLRFDDEHPMPVPGKGEVVCFFGEFATYVDHDIEYIRESGTISASAIAARGEFDDPYGFGTLAGAATGAKLMAVGRAEKHFQSSIHFLVEGPDGIPGTGDDCSIVYIGSSISSYTGGIDSISHFLDYMAVERLKGEVTFVLPAGNDGPGMGTLVSPAPRNALIVGSSEDNAFDTSGEDPEHMFGDVAPWSSRGPTASGFPKPDLIATGIGRFSRPLTYESTAGGEDTNVRTYKDSRISAAITAGTAAQVQQAFFEIHGRMPDMYETMGILKASATDMGYDTLAQGSGLLNAFDAILMATGEGGVMLTGLDIVPSNYGGQEYHSFPRIMEPGTSSAASIGIRNTGAARDLVYAVERHEPVWKYVMDFPDTGRVLLNFTDLIPTDISLLRVRAIASAEEFYNQVNMIPEVKVDNAFVVADWTEESDFPERGDMNILCQAEKRPPFQHFADWVVPSNVIELEVAHPHQKFQRNIFFALDANDHTDWKVVLTGYTQDSWDWISLDQAPGNLGADQDGTVAITATVPGGALPGTYGGSVRVMSQPIVVAGENLHTPPPGSIVDMHYEEVDITVGSNIGYLANGNIVQGTLELVQTRMESGKWESYRNSATDNNNITWLPDEDITEWPYNITIPGPEGVANGTPINENEFDMFILWEWSGTWYWDSLIHDWGYEEGVDFDVEYFVGGNISFYEDSWLRGPGEIYVNYTYEAQTVTSLVSPDDYTAELETGKISFTSEIGESTWNITANYTYVQGEFQRLHLDRARVNDDLVLTRYDIITGGTGTVPASEYEFSPLTGTVRFHEQQLNRYMINATYSYYNSTAIIPIAVTVGAAKVPDYTLGGEDNDWLNSPTAMTGGYRFGISDLSGDRRYFYFTVPEQGRYTNVDLYRSILNLDWADVPTDIEVIIYAQDENLVSRSDNVAPFIFKELGRSPVSAVAGQFLTSSGGSNETVAVQLSPGLNIVCLRAKLLSGVTESYPFQGRGGWLTFTDDDSRKLSTNQLDGSLPIQVMSNLEMDKGFHASVLGPAIAYTYTAEEVYQDDIFYDVTQEDWWRLNAASQYVRLLEVPEGTMSLDVRIIGYDDTQDLDLCLFYDGKHGEEDGVPQWDEFIDRTVCEDIDNYGWGGIGTTFNTYAYSAGPGVDQATKVLRPKAGIWIITVLGYEVSGNPGHFDLIVKMIREGVKGYEVSSDLPDSEEAENELTHPSTIPPFRRVNFGIDWNFPRKTTEDGGYSGVITIGNAYSRDVFSLQMDINLNRVPPALTDYYPLHGSYVNDPMTRVFCSFSDEEFGELDRSSVSIYVDGRNVTNEAIISVPFTRTSLNDPFGYWGGSALWYPKSPLSEGGHMVEVHARDMSGNTFQHTWVFTLDSRMPSLQLDHAEETIYVNVPEITLSGYTDSDATLRVHGLSDFDLNINHDGSFTIDIRLHEAMSELVITSTDLAGNSRVVRKQIILDQDSPTILRLFSSEGSVTRASSTNVYGAVSEPGTLDINGEPVRVNSDGSFSVTVRLNEGNNLITAEFRDLAGNSVSMTLNVTRDTLAPVVSLGHIPRTVHDRQLNITGVTEPGCTVRVNGKLVTILAASRQQRVQFTHTVTLSPGMNTIVVSSTDQAGNTAQETFTVNYLTDTGGRNWGAIGLMIALLAIGLVLGLILPPMILGGKKEEMPGEAEPAVEESMPEGEVPEEVMPPVEGLEEAMVVELPAEGDMEAVPPEEKIPGEEPVETATDAEPIPAEESLPEEPPAEPETEDPKIVKLREAHEAGKISKELYEKNLKKFRRT